MKRRFIILLVVALVVVLGLIFLWPRNGYRRAVEAYKKELIAKGEKLTMVELAPWMTNDLERAQQFMDLMTNYRAPTNLPGMMKMVAPGVAVVGHTNLTPNQMLGYEQNVSNVTRLRQILGSSVLHFNLDYSQGTQVRMPHLPMLKSAEQLASGAGMQALATNDTANARSAVFVMVDLVRLYDDDPQTLIGSLIYAALGRIAVAATWETLQDSHWTEPQLAELQAKWEGTDLFERTQMSVRMERAYFIAAQTEARETNYQAAADSLFGSPGSSGTSGGNGLFSDARDKLKEFYDRYPGYWKWKASWSYDEELYVLQINDAALQIARQAQATSALVPSLKEFNQRVAAINQLHRDSTNHFRLSEDWGTLFWLYMRKPAEAETARRMTVVAIALKRYQLQHNAYPATLNELVPVYLAAVPIDFMDGKPLRYKSQTDGNFLLYSVGEDGEDNGGDASGGMPDWLKGQDMVWPRAATAAEAAAFAKPVPRAGGMRDAPPGTIPPRPEPRPPGQ